MSEAAHRIVRRAFLTVGDRQVHYRSVGQGPPALFIHSSPTNSSFVLEDMLAQADHYSCFAFDTPGFGLSDPLPLAEMKVADLADAIVAAMDALGLPAVPVFGTHSGAAIALELGYRHPARITGLVLDGVPIFTREEVAPLHQAYFAPLQPDIMGGHYAATWTRFRDQSIWFPWCFRQPENLNEYDLGAPPSIHQWCEMFFAAAAHYKPAYYAVTSYCEGAVEAAAGLAVPAIFTATDTDMLFPHLKRLPPLKAGQTIETIGTSHERKRALTGEGFGRFGSPDAAPVVSAAVQCTDRVLRQFVMDGARAQMIRYLGDPSRPPLILLHDAPGSSLMWVERMAELATDHFVIAPDIPGSGESEGLAEGAELSDYAQAIWRLCDALGVDGAVIEGRGLGASLAVEMAAGNPARCSALRIDGLLLPDPEQRFALLQNFAPPVEIERDGAHWYRLWLRLRDSLVYWPWYDTRRVALRRAPTRFDADELHAWATEVMKQRATCHHFPNAVLRHDAAVRLRDCTVPALRIDDPLSALGAAYGERLDSLIETLEYSSIERIPS
ncbi:alpha/beta hydrolase [Sphingobium aromaticivastans]|uniref:alpha/beta fold hydrolase n=1 Tax=Sphingobium aromaticivastans TaxID=1778665 RepID=UPI003017750A